MDEDPQVTADRERYIAAAHGMRSGVAMKMNYDVAETEPKHLRVGVNNALVGNGALAGLLIAKGIITREEYYGALADAMERERDAYRDEIRHRFGNPGINLA